MAKSPRGELVNLTIQSLMQNIVRLFKQVTLSYWNVCQYCAYLYTAEKQIWQLPQALENNIKTGNLTQMCAAFKLSLCAAFLIIVIMLSDSRFIILISDADLQGQLILF